MLAEWSADVDGLDWLDGMVTTGTALTCFSSPVAN